MKVITIGRSPKNDIIVNDKRVSRNHLQIVQDDDGNVLAIDLNSTNGTFINGQRIAGTVPLNPNDTVQIGDTQLPWQNYFMKQPLQQVVRQPAPHTVSAIASPKSRRMIWYIVIAVVTVLFIGGGGVWYMHDIKQKKNEEEVAEKHKLEMEARNAEDEANSARIAASEASEQAEQAARKAAESKSKKDWEYANKMKKEAEVKQKLAVQKEDEAQKAKKAQQEAEKERDNALREKAKAEENAKLVEEEAGKVQSKLMLEKKEAEKKAELTKEFYKIFPILKDNKFKSVCDTLKITVPQGKEKDAVENAFDKADNTDKQKIINAIKDVKSHE